MKRKFIALICLAFTMTASAQNENAYKIPHVNKPDKWFNHVDIGITGGTSGIGFDIAVPMTEWARLRAGAVFRPITSYDASFGMEMAEGLSIIENNTRYAKLADMMYSLTSLYPTNYVNMSGDMNMNNAKILVDIFPFKNNRHWHVTAGVFIGNSSLVEIKNNQESMSTIMAVTIYNSMYRKTLEKKNPISVEGLEAQWEAGIEKLRKWGRLTEDDTEQTVDYTYTVKTPFGDETVSESQTLKHGGKYSEHGISVPMGKFKREIVAQEDIYYDYSVKMDQTLSTSHLVGVENLSIDINDPRYYYQKDENGRYIKEGSIRYKKGEVIYSEGDEFRMVPDENNIIRAEGITNTVKPYIGIGYECAITKNNRMHLSIDAGVMVWGGNPSININTPIGVNAAGEKVFATCDLTRDLSDMRPKVEDYVNRVRKYPVFPEVSLRISHRIW